MFQAVSFRIRTRLLEEEQQWQVSTEIGGHVLDATLDLKSNLPIARSVDGNPFGQVIFAVDGRELLQPIWARLDKLRADGQK